MISSTLSTTGSRCLLMGAVRGRVGEIPPILEALAGFSPRGIGVGISFDELTSLTDHFVHRPSEPLVPLTGSETSEVLGLAKFGEVRVPHPAYVAVLEWAQEHRVAVEALDPSDETYATLFTDHIGYVELVRRTVRERRTTRHPPAAADADEFALKWEESIASGRGSRSFLRAREGAIADAVRKLVARSGPVAVLVDRERYPAVRELLAGPSR